MTIETDAEHAVEWTKPEDFQVDAKNPIQGLFIRPGGIFLVQFVDGSVHALPESIDAGTLNALFTASGGEVVQVPQ